jgi:hypothetical protein
MHDSREQSQYHSRCFNSLYVAAAFPVPSRLVRCTIARRALGPCPSCLGRSVRSVIGSALTGRSVRHCRRKQRCAVVIVQRRFARSLRKSLPQARAPGGDRRIMTMFIGNSHEQIVDGGFPPLRCKTFAADFV